MRWVAGCLGRVWKIRVEDGLTCVVKLVVVVWIGVGAATGTIVTMIGVGVRVLWTVNGRARALGTGVLGTGVGSVAGRPVGDFASASVKGVH